MPGNPDSGSMRSWMDRWPSGLSCAAISFTLKGDYPGKRFSHKGAGIRRNVCTFFSLCLLRNKRRELGSSLRRKIFGAMNNERKNYANDTSKPGSGPRAGVFRTESHVHDGPGGTGARD